MDTESPNDNRNACNDGNDYNTCNDGHSNALHHRYRNTFRTTARLSDRRNDRHAPADGTRPLHVQRPTVALAPHARHRLRQNRLNHRATATRRHRPRHLGIRHARQTKAADLTLDRLAEMTGNQHPPVPSFPNHCRPPGHSSLP